MVYARGRLTCNCSLSDPFRTGPFRKVRRVKKEEMAKVEAFLRKRFSNPAIEVRARPKKTDSAEVYIGKRDEDFLAVLYREDEDGEVSYQFQMAILDIDLEDV